MKSALQLYVHVEQAVHRARVTPTPRPQAGRRQRVSFVRSTHVVNSSNGSLSPKGPRRTYICLSGRPSRINGKAYARGAIGRHRYHSSTALVDRFFAGAVHEEAKHRRTLPFGKDTGELCNPGPPPGVGLKSIDTDRPQSPPRGVMRSKFRFPKEGVRGTKAPGKRGTLGQKPPAAGGDDEWRECCCRRRCCREWCRGGGCMTRIPCHTLRERESGC